MLDSMGGLTPVRRRKLGNTGLEVSEVGLGGWQLGDQDDWGGIDARTAQRVIHEALEGGISLFDTAPNYACGDSERILGEALAGRRSEVVLVSKFGHRPEGNKDFSVTWFWESLEQSLRRLRTDYLDLLLLHNPDPAMYEGVDPLWGALERSREQGKIRHYGVSLDSAREIEACLRNTRSEVLEILFNILHQDVRRALPLVRERRVGTIVKVPLDSGWLTGRMDSASRFTGIRARWTPDVTARRAELVARLGWLTADGSELASKAIAYLLAYDEVSCVIPGVRSSGQLQVNLRAGLHQVTLGERERLEAFWDDFTDRGSHPLPW
jgi:aryl-alcohol dehydrogenase-like predicted oxidoreductase